MFILFVSCNFSFVQNKKVERTLVRLLSLYFIKNLENAYQKLIYSIQIL